MAVRRLETGQPGSFAFTPENMAWAEMIIARYPPGKQASAVLPVLWRAQEQNGGWTSEPAIRAVADLLGMAYIRVYEIATFYTMFQLSPVGRLAHLQVCGTTPCMLRGSEGLIEVCRRRVAAEPHRLSEDGAFSWEEVECLGCCANAPVVQIGKDTFEDMTPESLRRLLDALARGRPVRTGSQIGRRASCPDGGPTTLKDASLYDGSTVGRWQSRFLAETSESASRPQTPPPAPPKATSQEVLPDEKPPVLDAPRGGQKDDLMRIAGIDAELETVLNRLGIFHFDQIAAWNETHLRWLDQHVVGREGAAGRRAWVEQAKRFAAS